ncbi:MAG: ABC transporter permease [Anaerorhabdus sp.]
MNKTLTIIKKELKRYFSDPKLLFQVVLLPGLIIYIMYSFMGSFLFSSHESEEVTPIQAIAINLPIEMKSSFETMNFELVDSQGIDSDVKKVEDGEVDVVLQFPDNFIEMTNEQQSVAEVEVYYDSAKDKSYDAYMMAISYLTEYEEAIANVLNINSDENKTYNVIKQSDIVATMLSMLLPMLSILFLYSTCMAITPSAIAGEKERGTIATLLVTPIKRIDLAMGKVIGLSVIAFLSSMSSILGTLLSLPKLMGVGEMSLSAYGMMDAIIYIAGLLSLLPIFLGVMLMISATSKNEKEAATVMTPLMIVAIVGGIAPMMGLSSENLISALIPACNVSVIINDLLMGKLVEMYAIVSVVVNLAYGVICVFILKYLLDSEKWMFS